MTLPVFSRCWRSRSSPPGRGGGRCSDPPGAEETVRDYLDALSQKDARRAWDLLAADARSTLDPGLFEARVRETDAAKMARLETAAAVASLAAVEARWSLDHGRLVVARDGDRWLLRLGMLALYPRETPLSALRSFVAAYRRSRTDVLLSLAPPPIRRRLTASGARDRFDSEELRESLEPRVAELERVLSTQIAIEPDEGDPTRATFHYGPYRAVLERHDRDWFVADL